MITLFSAYPNLEKKLPFHPLCDLPTEVHPMTNLQAELDLDSLFVKRDDKTNSIFGGNKVRKLEFTLGEAARTNFNTVITFGFAGSNHATATAVHCRSLNLDCISMLMPQPNAHYVRENLLLAHTTGAELRHFTKKFRLSLATMAESLKRGVKTGKTPYIIPPGGTSPQGTLGYVNAAWELKHQIDAGTLETPDRIYLPLGTAGTSIGLLIGLKLAGLDTRIVPVRVVDHDFTDVNRAKRLFHDTVAFLRTKDPSIPKIGWEDDDFQIVDDFLGDGYAHFTQAGIDAVNLARETENLELDGCYTGKALAALLAHAKNGDLRGQRVLFWNTRNSSDFSAKIADSDPKSLPPELHRYFTQEVQSLDLGTR